MSDLSQHSYEAMKHYMFLSVINERRIVLNSDMPDYLSHDASIDFYRMDVNDLAMFLRTDTNQYKALSRLLQTNGFHDDLLRRLDKALNMGVRLIDIHDKHYPELLKTIPSAPNMLWVLGHDPLAALSKPSLTIVGTRAPSPYGERVAKDVARYIALRDRTVVSGLALGIDGHAHQATLNADGTTIAVVASGVDVIYPPQHVALYHNIIRNGAVISEYPPGLPTHPSRFPVRNRILAGLSAVTVVVESTMRSGTLHTTTHALEFGREVMVVPGNIYSPTSKGTNALLAEGATPLLQCSDMDPFIFGIHSQRSAQGRDGTKALGQPVVQGDNENENTIINMLTTQNLALEQIFSAGNWHMHEVIESITNLESKGIVTNFRGRYALTSQV